MSDLRSACEHGRYERHRLGVIGTPNRTVCPGGREVTLPEDVPEWWMDHDAHAIFGKSFHSIEAGWRYFRHLWFDAADFREWVDHSSLEYPEVKSY